MEHPRQVTTTAPFPWMSYMNPIIPVSEEYGLQDLLPRVSLHVEKRVLGLGEDPPAKQGERLVF